MKTQEANDPSSYESYLKTVAFACTQKGAIGRTFTAERHGLKNGDDAFSGCAELLAKDIADKHKVFWSYDIYKLAIFCKAQADKWFEGFEDDTNENRMDFTASLYHELKPVLVLEYLKRRSGQGSAMIANNTLIPRNEVYRILHNLEENRLIEKSPKHNSQYFGWVPTP